MAINLTISAADYYMQPIQRTLNESIRAGSFLQTVNSTGMAAWSCITRLHCLHKDLQGLLRRRKSSPQAQKHVPERACCSL